MKIISIKDLNHPVPIPLIVILALFLSFGKGSAKKADPLQHLLEKNNLQFHKKITIFDPGQRLNPGKNKKIYKASNRLSGSELRNISTEYLNLNKRRLDLKDINNQLRLDRVLKSPAGTHLYYQEMMEGIPVYNSGIVVSMNLDNEVSFISRNYSPDYRSGAIQVQISPDQALERAREYLNVSGQLRGDQYAEKMIYSSAVHGPILCYRIEIPAVSPFGDWEVFVNAQTGDIVRVKNLIIAKSGTNGTGTVWDPDPLTTGKVYYGEGEYSDNNDDDNEVLNAQRILVALNDLYTNDQNEYILEGPYVKLTNKDAPFDVFPHLSSPDSFLYTRQQQEFEAVMVYYHIDKAYRRLLELGFFTDDTVQGLQEFEADPHGNFGLDNSYYSPILNYCSFGEGGVDDAEDAAVIWHEYEHAIQYNISNISHDASGETRSLLEGCSDYWAASYNRRQSSFAWNHVFIWDAGIQSASGDTTFWAGRRCDLDWKYTKEDSATYAGTHAFGQIWSSALMRIWSDLGADITDKLFITSHYYWGTHPEFNEAAEEFIQADIDVFGGAHLPVIMQWFEFHGLIDPKDYQPQISHDPATDVQTLSDSYSVRCQIVPSKSALDTAGLWLIWSLDSVFIDSSQLIADSSNYFYAEIPGVTEPSAINYYFYARDSLNITSVNPDNAPDDYFSFYAGPDSLPPPPQNIVIIDSINIVDLRWQELITGKYISYHIYRSEEGGDFFLIDSTSSSAFTDTTVSIGFHYYYYVTTVFNPWESNPSDTIGVLVQAITGLEDINILPSVYKLEQNYPNPFNPTTIINYELPITNDVDLSIYNLVGQKIATLVREKQQAGSYQVEWDASSFASGVYYYVITAGEFRDVKKMILIR